MELLKSSKIYLQKWCTKKITAIPSWESGEFDSGVCHLETSDEDQLPKHRSDGWSWQLSSHLRRTWPQWSYHEMHREIVKKVKFMPHLHFIKKRSANDEFIQLTDGWYMSNINVYYWYTLFCIYHFIYIYIYQLFYEYYMNSVSIGRSPPYLPSFFHVVKSPPSNTVYLVAFWSWRNWSPSTAEDAMVMYLQTAPRSHTDSHPQEWCVHHVSATVVLASALRRKKL